MPAAASVSQLGWYFCPKCSGLYYSSAPNDPNERGWCPAGGSHRYLGGRGYVLFADYEPGLIQSNYQGGWRFCFKCHAMHYAFGVRIGMCPAGGGYHATSPSGNYQIWAGAPQFASQQRGWRFCGQCSGLWYAGNGTRGRCTNTGAGHTTITGGNYVLIKA